MFYETDCIYKTHTQSKVSGATANAAGPAYYVLHPQKGITICLFLTYQAFKNREGIVSQTNLAE